MDMDRDPLAEGQGSGTSEERAMQIGGNRFPGISEALSLHLNQYIGRYPGASPENGIVIANLAHKASRYFIIALLIVRNRTSPEESRAAFQNRFPMSPFRKLMPRPAENQMTRVIPLASPVIQDKVPSRTPAQGQSVRSTGEICYFYLNRQKSRPPEEKWRTAQVLVVSVTLVLAYAVPQRYKSNRYCPWARRGPFPIRDGAAEEWELRRVARPFFEILTVADDTSLWVL